MTLPVTPVIGYSFGFKMVPGVGLPLVVKNTS